MRTPAAKRRNVISGLLFGLGVITFLDEVVFHQLLHWHHFYDRSTSAAGLVSDGLARTGARKVPAAVVRSSCTGPAA